MLPVQSIIPLLETCPQGTGAPQAIRSALERVYLPPACIPAQSHSNSPLSYRSLYRSTPVLSLCIRLVLPWLRHVPEEARDFWARGSAVPKASQEPSKSELRTRNISQSTGSTNSLGHLCYIYIYVGWAWPQNPLHVQLRNRNAPMARKNIYFFAASRRF